MPSSSARCSQLPRAVDKVPFYEALKKFRDHLNGKIPSLDDSEICFPDLELKTAKKEPKTEGYDEELTAREMEAQINNAANSLLAQFTQGNYQVIPHTNAEDFPDLPNLNGISVPQIKQEPIDNESYSLSRCSNISSQVTNTDKANTAKVTKKRGRPPKAKPTLTQSTSSSSLPTTQQSQNNASLGRSLSLNSLSSHSQQAIQSDILPQIKQELPDNNEQITSTNTLTTGSTQSPSQVNCIPYIKQEPQDVDFSCMPKLQQFPRVKQEPEELRDPSCSQNQSHISSYSQYLNADQPDHLSQNGNITSNQSNSFLQGLLGMVNKVANQQQSNYGMVSLTNQTHTGSQPLQFNDALCDIVKESSYDMEDFSGPVIKTEPDTENMAKQKPTRKRKSNSKPASTVTSAEENKQHLDSSPNVYPVTTNETYLQQNLHNVPSSAHSDPTENYLGPQHFTQNPSHHPNGMFSKLQYPPYPGQVPITDYQHYINGFNLNSLHQSNNFRQSVPSFSQMMAQDLDSFGKYQYGKDFPQPQVREPFSGTNTGFPGQSHPYSYGQETWGHPANLSQESLRRMSADAVSHSKEKTNDHRLAAGALPSQAFHDTAFDLRLAPEKPRSEDETDQQQTSQQLGSFETDSTKEAGGKKEKLD